MKTAFGGDSGEHFKGQEKLAIRRRKTEGSGPPVQEAPPKPTKPASKKVAKKTSKKTGASKKKASKKKGSKGRRNAA